jgi:hypothetical protein
MAAILAIEWNWEMSSSKRDLVNLDALIPREDLESKKPGPPSTGGIPVSQLALGQHYYGLLRKPLFQRETDDWSVDNVVSLVKSYRDGHLIPAVILWTAQGYTFVIDGAHRLSVFIAWVNNDFGDGQMSAAFFKEIPRRQLEIAAECKKRIESASCAYATLSHLTSLPSRTQEQLAWSTNIAKAVETQHVVGDANVAAESFLAINQRAVQIDPTEKYMIEYRQKANVIAARALVNGARGHRYWGSFESVYIAAIEQAAKSIYGAIYEPEDAIPEANTDLQAAGQARTASGLRIALDLVNITNSVNLSKPAPDDPTGEVTARQIEKTFGVVKYLSGRNRASLGLHPAVYFWGATGNHRPAIFLAVIAWLQELISKDELIQFTLYRARFEEFLVSSDVVKEVLRRYGGWKKSVSPVKKIFRTMLDALVAGKTDSEIESLVRDLQGVPESQQIETISTSGKWRQTKSALRHEVSLQNAIRCAICKARLVVVDASDDHIVRRADGGPSTVANAQLTHQFCNSGFKEHFAQRAQQIPEITFPAFSLSQSV